jgi:hypothetical protein
MPVVKRPVLEPLRTLLTGSCEPVAPLVAELPVNPDSLSWASPEVEAEQL